MLRQIDVIGCDGAFHLPTISTWCWVRRRSRTRLGSLHPGLRAGSGERYQLHRGDDNSRILHLQDVVLSPASLLSEVTMISESPTDANPRDRLGP